MSAMVSSRLCGDSHVVVGVVSTEVGLETVKGLGIRMKAPIATCIIEEAGGKDEVVANPDDGEFQDGFTSSVSEMGTAIQLAIQ